MCLPRLDKTPVFRNDAHAHDDLVEDTLDRESARQPHFVLWTVRKRFEQRKGLLLGLKWPPPQWSGSEHVADPNGTFKVEQ